MSLLIFMIFAPIVGSISDHIEARIFYAKTRRKLPKRARHYKFS